MSFVATKSDLAYTYSQEATLHGLGRAANSDKSITKRQVFFFLIANSIYIAKHTINVLNHNRLIQCCKEERLVSSFLFNYSVQYSGYNFKLSKSMIYPIIKIHMLLKKYICVLEKTYLSELCTYIKCVL